MGHCESCSTDVSLCKVNMVLKTSTETIKLIIDGMGSGGGEGGREGEF